MCIVAECLRYFQVEGSCIMHHFCSFLFTILFCTGVQSVLQYTQVPHDQQPLPQQLHAAAEQPHVPLQLAPTIYQHSSTPRSQDMAMSLVRNQFTLYVLSSKR